MSDRNERRLLSVHEVAAKLGIARLTAYGLVASGALRPVRIGRRVLVATDELDRFIDAGGTAECVTAQERGTG
jgi:excisionase family DNA binding protein